MATTKAGFVKLVASQNSGELPDLISFHKFILAQPQGSANLSALSSMLTPPAPPASDLQPPAKVTSSAASSAAAAGFSNQASATGSVINLWFYQRVHLEVSPLGKRCDINMGGITPGFPAGANVLS
jgi:hypothetical protein